MAVGAALFACFVRELRAPGFFGKAAGSGSGVDDRSHTSCSEISVMMSRGEARGASGSSPGARIVRSEETVSRLAARQLGREGVSATVAGLGVGGK